MARTIAMTMALAIWVVGAYMIYLFWLWDPLYASFYLISACLLAYAKITMYKGDGDIVSRLVEDFYGWTTILVLVLTIPITFFFMGDE